MVNENLDNERLMDHEYDGIREYDNPLPGWWVWSFWLSILFCFPYWYFVHVAEGNTLRAEYDAELVAYEEQLLLTFGDLKPDEQTILKHMADERAMAAMKGVFATRCSPCHKPDGTGLVGPNLTDDHWIQVKNVTDIYTNISEGVLEKGMPPWKGQLSDTQIVLLSAYVAALRNNPLPGKEPQGEVIDPWPTPE